MFCRLIFMECKYNIHFRKPFNRHVLYVTEKEMHNVFSMSIVVTAGYYPASAPSISFCSINENVTFIILGLTHRILVRTERHQPWDIPSSDTADPDPTILETPRPTAPSTPKTFSAAIFLTQSGNPGRLRTIAPIIFHRR